MKKALNEAKGSLLVSLYFIAAYGVSLFLTILTHWNFGVFIFGIVILTLIIAIKRYNEKVPEHARRQFFKPEELAFSFGYLYFTVF